MAPNESTVIDVYVDTRQFRGQKTKAIFFTISGAEHSSVAELRVSANSRTDVVYNPGEVEFDTVPGGQTPSQTLDVEYAGEPAWKITKLTAPAGAPFDATVKEAYRQPGKVGYQVTATLKPGAVPGPFQEPVILETNDPNSPQLTVLVKGTVQREVWSLGTVTIGEALTRRVVVRGNKPFLVLGIEGPEGVKLEDGPSKEASPVQTVAIRLPPAQLGKFHYEIKIKIKTDLEDAPLTVVVDGKGVEPPPSVAEPQGQEALPKAKPGQDKEQRIPY